MAHVKVIYPDWNRLDRDGRWSVMTEGKTVDADVYETIFETEMEGESDTILGALFERFNIGDHGGLTVRSMSVGDLVDIDGTLFVCKPVGWERVA